MSDEPKWDKKYERMGVTARELYMRQNGLCWLKPEVDGEGKVVIYCTDGKEKAETARMLNPTFECVRCMMRFTTNAIEKQVSPNKQTSGEDDSSTTS